MAIENAMQGIKHRIINYSILLGGTIGLLIFIIQNVLTSNQNSDVRLLFDLFAISILWIIWFSRHKISLVIKSSIVISAVFILWAQGIYHIGFLSHNTILFILLPLFLTLAINIRLNILLSILFAVVYICIAFAFTNGYLELDISPSERINDLSQWLIHFLLLAIISFVVIVILNSYKSYFKKLINTLEEKNLELNRHQNHLSKLVEERTKKLNIANTNLSSSNKELEDKNELILKQNTELHNTLNNLKNAQSKLIEAEKMASLGTLTAGVAHEINNPLNYIMGAHVGLSNYFEENGSVSKDETDIFLESIHTGINRVSNIVSGLNQFSRDNDSFDETCNIHSILDNCLAMLQNQLKHRVNLIQNYYPEDIIAKGNVGKLHQVFLNILHNGIQAIEDFGEITINTKIIDDLIQITICDNGVGIKKEHLEKVMEPFFTTKLAGEGSGLGLSICNSIIQNHHGTLVIESEQYVDTKVIITIPKSKEHEQ